MPRLHPLPLSLDDRPLVAIYRSPLFNASETFVQAHAAGLTRYQPLLVGLDDKENARRELQSRIVIPDSAWEKLRFKVFGLARALAARLASASPCLVHAHFGTDGLLALPLAQSLGVPLVTTLHGYDVGRTRGRMLLSGRLSWMRYAFFRRRLMESGALFLTVSDAVRCVAIAQGYPAERIATHYLGVDLDRFRAADRPREPGLILHVGRLVEKKGTAVLLQAFAAVRANRPAARLLVIGDGPERPALEQRAASLGLASAVSFAGMLPEEEVAAWMRRASLLAAPSLTARDGDAEGLPTVIVEAAASGLAVIGSDHAGIPEAIIDGKTGFVVPERDADARAARMTQVLGSAELRERMG